MRLHLASGNPHKVAELAAFAAVTEAQGLGPRIEIISARAIGGMPQVEEDAGTFVGNARKKAQALHARLPKGSCVLADDSGVCVDALGGAPGVESAYYAGPEANPVKNVQKLLRTMESVPDQKRGAHFLCVLLVLTGDGQELVFEGICGGYLLREMRGGAGFGYDPIFVPHGYVQSYAELGDSVKNRISHRARAWAKLAEWAGRDGSPSRP